MKLWQWIGVVTMAMALPSHAAEELVAKFPTDGISRVVFRASAADKATVRTAPGVTEVKISGRLTGGAKGYHSSDPNWKETPASEWGMKFVAEKFGPTLVISTFNETAYIHHIYTIQDILIELPQGIELSKEVRRLSGDGAPDLRAP